MNASFSFWQARQLAVVAGIVVYRWLPESDDGGPDGGSLYAEGWSCNQDFARVATLRRARRLPLPAGAGEAATRSAD